MSSSRSIIEQLSSRLKRIYPEVTDHLLGQMESVISDFTARRRESLEGQPETDPQREDNVSRKRLEFKNGWDESDVVLITYGDQVSSPAASGLNTLGRLLKERSISSVINNVHLLPFFPYSSDDGFSVMDYYGLGEGMGDWEDVAELNEQVFLMFDLVLNHCSAQSDWFKAYLNLEQPYLDFFHEVEPESDLSEVTRPRALPLLTRFERVDGSEKHIWTTFSDDQVDLNFANPEVLLEFVRIFLFYVEQGARIIRLDAIAFLWKEVGTCCLHLSRTHEVVKLLRDVIEIAAPEVILLTETNVPHDENVSYFGDGDEAHMVYQFSLPPLLLDAFVHRDASPLIEWLRGLENPPGRTTYFNFTASHDGIGVRPLEGLLPDDRFQSLVEKMKERGGLVGMRNRPDGSQVPYELNITYLDAISEPTSENGIDPQKNLDRFLASQAVMLSLPGIPGVYFHSLFGTPNDRLAADQSGIPRRINRRKYDFDELAKILDDGSSSQSRVFRRYHELLKVRVRCAAFHPDGPFELLEFEDSRVLGFYRLSPDGLSRVLVIANPTSDEFVYRFAGATTNRLLAGNAESNESSVRVAPFGFCWLAVE